MALQEGQKHRPKSKFSKHHGKNKQLKDYTNTLTTHTTFGGKCLFATKCKQLEWKWTKKNDSGDGGDDQMTENNIKQTKQAKAKQKNER